MKFTAAGSGGLVECPSCHRTISQGLGGWSTDKPCLHCGWDPKQEKTGNADAIHGIVVRAWIGYSGKTHWEEYAYQEQPLLNDSEDFLRIAVQRHIFDFNHTDEGMRHPKRLLDIEIVARKLDPLYCELIHLFAHEWELEKGSTDRLACKICGVRAFQRNFRTAVVIPQAEKLKHPFGCIPHLRPI